MKNLVWTNANPDGTPCPVCQELIGCVFEPDSAPPCPVHPSCYCLLLPTDQEVNTTADATGFSDSSQETWAKYKAYLLRKGFDVPSFLQPLEARHEGLAPSWQQAERISRERQKDGITPGRLGQYGHLMRLEDITPDSLEGPNPQFRQGGQSKTHHRAQRERSALSGLVQTGSEA